MTGEWCAFASAWVGVFDSGDGSTGESFAAVGVVGVVITANGGGIGFRLNFADGPRRSRIFADDELGEFVGESEKDETGGVFETGELGTFVDVDRFATGDAGGGRTCIFDMGLELDGE